MKKEIDIDDEMEKRWDNFYDWLDTCPFKWTQSRHPTSGMTAINFDIEEERPLDDLKGLIIYVAKCFDDYKRGND